MLSRRDCIAALSLPFAAKAASDSSQTLDQLQRNLRKLTEESGGTMGIAARHLPSGQQVSVNGNQRFPMQSVYKLPIALTFLRKVDAGQIRLLEAVELKTSDQRPGFSPLAGQVPLTITYQELLRAVLVESDNTASDRLLALVGGPEAVTAQLRAWGVTGINVSRPEGQIFLDYYGVREAPPPEQWSLAMFQKLASGVPAEQALRSARLYATDPRDTATPEAMVALLTRVHALDLISLNSSTLLLDMMVRCTRAPGRLKGLLPPNTPVAHRPGTGGEIAGVNACTNDVGLIELPSKTGAIACAVFTKSSDRSLAQRERTIAKAARLLFDYWSA